MIRIALALMVAVTPQVALAGHCVQNVVQQPQALVRSYYVQQQPVYLQQVQPYAYFSTGAAIQEQAMTERITAGVIKALDRRLGQAVVTPPMPAPEHPGVAILAKRCSGCHKQGAKSVTDNGAPVMFDANMQFTGTRDDAMKSLVLARRGAMPPPPAPQFTEDDYLYVKNYFDSRWKEPTK